MANQETQSEFARSQFEQAVETYRTQFSLLIQIATVLVVANATIVGYAMSKQTSGILFVGPLFPIVILLVANAIFRLSIPIVYTAVSLEHRYGEGDSDWLASTFLMFAASNTYVEEMKAICSIENHEERMKRLHSLYSPVFGKHSKMRIALILVAIAQVFAPIVLS